MVELATGQVVSKLEMPTSSAGPLAFSVDGKRLAIGFGRANGEVRLLDLVTMKPIAVLSDLGSGPHALSLSPDGKYLITGLNDQTALVWDLGRVLARKTRKEEP
jgi:WD40 repeat protein